MTAIFNFSEEDSIRLNQIIENPPRTKELINYSQLLYELEAAKLGTITRIARSLLEADEQVLICLRFIEHIELLAKTLIDFYPLIISGSKQSNSNGEIIIASESQPTIRAICPLIIISQKRLTMRSIPAELRSITYCLFSIGEKFALTDQFKADCPLTTVLFIYDKKNEKELHLHHNREFRKLSQIIEL